MTHIVAGTYDGRAMQFDEPLPYPANTRLVAALEQEAPSPQKGVSWTARARELKLQGPTDLSVRLHEYLYGGDADDGK